MADKTIHFSFGIHNHQPVGNFAHVFESAYQDAYLPLVELLLRHPGVKISIHYSGPLWDYLQENHSDFFDKLQALVDQGRLEMLGGAYYEPILPNIPDRDKVGQIKALSREINRVLGVTPRGMWTAERVWEPHLASPMARAGIKYTVLDESHVSLPQLRGMYNGDQARKNVLIEHGFRLPSARDNRPLAFNEFLGRTGQIIGMSATPGPYEREVSPPPVPQIIRPTGLLDPAVTVRPLKGQIDDLIEEVRACAERHERVLVTTLTKKTAEDLSDYLSEAGLRVTYLHSDIDAIERVEVLRGLRKGEVDCLVGINLLREGLDLPEVSLVAILDADKEGFLRSETALIQTAGRAARHVTGRVIMYADRVTDSMRRALAVMEDRRRLQGAYNRQHAITPRSIQKSIQESLVLRQEGAAIERRVLSAGDEDFDIHEAIQDIEREMLEAAEALEFERAAMLRDQLFELKNALKPGPGPGLGSDRAPGKRPSRKAR